MAWRSLALAILSCAVTRPIDAARGRGKKATPPLYATRADRRQSAARRTAPLPGGPVSSMIPGKVAGRGGPYHDRETLGRRHGAGETEPGPVRRHAGLGPGHGGGAGREGQAALEAAVRR